MLGELMMLGPLLFSCLGAKIFTCSLLLEDNPCLSHCFSIMQVGKLQLCCISLQVESCWDPLASGCVVGQGYQLSSYQDPQVITVPFLLQLQRQSVST